MDILLTPDDVAKILQIDVDTVRRYLKTGILKGMRFGAGTKRPRWRVKEKDLEEFLSDKRIT
jgi:excisionase family DNA binding protein